MKEIGLKKDAVNLAIEPELSDLDTGWAWVVLVASFYSFALIGGSMYSVGIIHSVLLEHFQASVVLMAWVGALHTGIMSLGGLLSTAMTDRLSCRTAIICSGLFCSGGYFATAFVPSVEAAVVTCGIIVGIGAALGYNAAMVVVGFIFRKRRNLALDIAVSGVGMQSNLVTFGMLCFPSKLENHSHTLRQRDSERLSKSANVFKRKVMPYFNVIRKKGIFCLCLSMFLLYCTGLYLLFLHLPQYITTKGFSENQAAYLISLLGIFTTLGRFLTGVVANIPNCNEIILYAGSMAIVSIATIVYPFISQHFAVHLTYTIFLGLFFGSCYVVLTTASLKFIGINFIATAIGLEFMIGGVGAILGPVFAGS
ncbi:LOW QUALITY PROTEIN: monocarboxylate transporter 2-like [Mya arenaria]|uniref:LOW QUALITY PROTEIN: monocarboxylate transporter 2-like n=1 Tax=Mya arenaria TaxID=6604 RepID=UPI0022E67E84|nr:LOW QUALITY PROTEIN: monocarboxylate transporter 2-like [Mya arenaria]